MSELGHSLLFAMTSTAVALLLDLVLWGGYRTLRLAANAGSTLMLHGLGLGSVFVIAGTAALLVFATRREKLPSPTAVSVLGVIFGLVGPPTAFALTAAAGALAGGSALFALALVTAGFGQSLFARK